jgi:cysteinyl-tRNA synthetase
LDAYGYINVDNQKMSKSLNNFFTVRDIAAEFDLEAVRMFMLSVQYRNPVNFSRELILQAESALERLRTAKERLAEAAVAPEGTEEDTAFLAQVEELKSRFCDAMDDDLNTADALGALFEFARASNTFVSVPRGKAALDRARMVYDELTGVLGLLVHKAEEEFPAKALELLEERQAARKAKDFSRADQIRDALKEMGFSVEDTANGPKLKNI